MESQAHRDRVNIRPGVKVLSVLRHLNYQPWFALAEFVDNSIQSFIDYKDELFGIDEEQFKLRVNIDIDHSDGGRITIRDNAAGIHQIDYARAFRPAEIPSDTGGLCEFGMGMKSAACWFSPTWKVRGSALGEPNEKTVIFDISRIVDDDIEELDVDIAPIDQNAHFTEIVLENLYRVPIGRTVAKIKEHLTDIYRIYIQENVLELRYNDEELIYQEPEILVAPYYRDMNGVPITWRKEIDFDFGQDLRATGFAAIRQTASTTRAGFALFRRKRLIQGSADEGYRPEIIFAKPNSFIYQRVFGEIHLDGFNVSHTKDGFQWDENEEPFLDLLKEHLSKSDLPLLQQAREYRVQRRREDYQRGAEAATTHTCNAIKEHVPPILSQLRDDVDENELPEDLPETDLASSRTIDVDFQGQLWRIIIELSSDPAVGDWLGLSDQIVPGANQVEDGRRVVRLRLSLTHPFMERYCGVDREEIEPLLRLAAALGLGEFAARDSGLRYAGTIRRNVNELLRNALSRP